MDSLGTDHRYTSQRQCRSCGTTESPSRFCIPAVFTASGEPEILPSADWSTAPWQCRRCALDEGDAAKTRSRFTGDPGIVREVIVPDDVRFRY